MLFKAKEERGTSFQQMSLCLLRRQDSVQGRAEHTAQSSPIFPPLQHLSGLPLSVRLNHRREFAEALRQPQKPKHKQDETAQNTQRPY